MKWNNSEHPLWIRVVISALIGALVGLFLTASAAHGQVLGAGTQEALKEYWGQKASDFFDQLLMHESTKLFVALAITLAAGIGLIGASFLIMRARDGIEKKIEDEANEIKAFNSYVTQRLLESISDQMKKDLFQTIAQGQAALWKPRE